MLSAPESILLDEKGTVHGRTLTWDLGAPELVSILFKERSDLTVVEDGIGVLRESIDRGLPAERTHHAPFPGPGPYDAIFIKGARDRERGRMQLAWAAANLRADGLLLMVGEGGSGIKGYRRFLEGLFGRIEGVSRRHCRLWRCRRPTSNEVPDIVPRPTYEIPGLGSVYSLPGVFAWRALDKGTGALLKALPDGWEGKRVLDLGCGNGGLALHGASHGAEFVDALDDSSLALASAKATLAGRGNVKVFAAEAGDRLEKKFDVILCNPPTHRGSRHDLGLTRRFIEAAADALRDGGELWAVFRKELPVEGRFLRGCFEEPERHSHGGFLVCRAVKKS